MTLVLEALVVVLVLAGIALTIATLAALTRELRR